MILLQSAGTGTSSLIMFGMIFAVMYFFMIRPQVKKQKQEREYRSALKTGDSVITIGGIYGKITDVKENAVIIEVHGGSKLKIAKTAVSMTGESGIEK
ncbi:MAG: preprotein translocase subunit YajC [Flavobacteriales bacterium]|jgi:preprotein translocase subunit YajC|nr:preprotein translocase subunit YajC [Flavobacteriales bacterium]MBT5090528.1 preprotein translocase subunit YajC [Flavobacteriales bacterium]MBT5750390.1 preprotein translocase subunit YajC [Flavobacteriales bacterium]